MITEGEMGSRTLRFECDGPLDKILEEIGETPLPPYIKRPQGSSPGDRERYQSLKSPFIEHNL